MKHSQQGFTLIEAAMVIGTVAIVSSGILATRSIIRTAQIQSIMGEYQLYTGAIKNFKTKYLQLPGDYSNATAKFGSDSPLCIVNSLTGGRVGGSSSGGDNGVYRGHTDNGNDGDSKAGSKGSTKTCNGDGDGKITLGAGKYEHINAWRHLGASGFINQNYTGSRVTSSVCAIDIRAGENVPASRLKGGMWNLGATRSGVPYTTGAPGNQFFPINTCTSALSMNALWLGGSLQDDNAQAASCAQSQVPVFTGREAYDIDAKFDDKRASSGKIRAQYNNTATYSTCYDPTSTATSGYKADATGMNCSLAFMFQQ